MKIARMTKITSLITTTFIVATFPFAAHATPTISSITGTTTHGGAVTVNGSGFGIKSPVAPLMWDPVYGQSAYAGLTNGSPIPKGAGYPWPVMSGSGTTPPSYKTTNPRGKSLACYSNQWSTYSGMGVVGNVDYSASCNRSMGGTGKLYISWWAYPVNYNYNTNNFYAADKFIRITPQSQWSTAAYIFVAQGQIQMYDFSLGYLANDYIDPKIIGNAWNRFEYTVDNSTSPRPRIIAATNLVTVSDRTASSPGFSVDLCGIADMGADYSNDPNPITLDFGEIYIDNTRARVEICNASTKAGSNHCEIQIPQNTWNDGQLGVKINQGSFPDNSTAYLIVVDASGNASAGKQITFGTSASGPAPPTATIPAK